MPANWTDKTKFTVVSLRLGERYALDHAAITDDRSRSAMAARYIRAGLIADGYAPDEFGKWTKRTTPALPEAAE